MEDLVHTGRALSTLGLTVEREDFIRRESDQPYAPSGPGDDRSTQTLTDFISLAGNAQVVELTVAADAPVAGKTLQTAKEDGLLSDESLVVAIERNGEIISATGQTEIQTDDVGYSFLQGRTRPGNAPGLRVEAGEVIRGHSRGRESGAPSAPT